MKLVYLLFLFLLIDLRVIYAVAPINDDCAGATVLTIGTSCSVVSGTLFDATQSLPANCIGADANEDVWYSFTATTPFALIQVSSATSLDLVVELYDACGGNFILCQN